MGVTAVITQVEVMSHNAVVDIIIHKKIRALPGFLAHFTVIVEFFFHHTHAPPGPVKIVHDSTP